MIATTQKFGDSIRRILLSCMRWFAKIKFRGTLIVNNFCAFRIRCEISTLQWCYFKWALRLEIGESSSCGAFGRIYINLLYHHWHLLSISLCFIKNICRTHIRKFRNNFGSPWPFISVSDFDVNFAYYNLFLVVLWRLKLSMDTALSFILILIKIFLFYLR